MRPTAKTISKYPNIRVSEDPLWVRIKCELCRSTRVLRIFLALPGFTSLREGVNTL